MTDIIKAYLGRYFEPSFTESLIRRRSLEEAKLNQAFYEYLDLDQNRLMRLKDDPSGLRNIGNTCYFNVFLQLLYHVNAVRDMFLQGAFRTEKGTLPASFQQLFAQMLFSKFSYCDPSEVFTTLNRSNTDKIQLGDEYDFNEYFAMTLDTIEKCLKKEPSMENKEKVLERVFYGKMNQYLDDGKNVSPSTAKFGMITLDVKEGSLERAFESFKNYSVDGYKTSVGTATSAKVRSEIVSFPELMTFYVNRVELKDGRLCKNNNRFEFPQVLQFNRQKDRFEYKLDKECEQVERKISRVQQLIEKKEYSKLLEALKSTEQFLEQQEYEDCSDLSLNMKDLNYNYGVFGTEASHEQTKKRLRNYIERLEKQEALLEKTLQNLKEERRVITEKAKTTQYQLFALMIHQGSAVSGHYFIFIYNEVQRKWRKYNDRFVTEVSAEEVQKIALGEANKDTNMSCLIYKASEFRCDPFAKPAVSASLKNSVNKYDDHVAENINRVRLERMLRNCSDVVKEEVEYLVEAYQQDPLVFINYFSDPTYFYIGNGQLKMAQFLKVKGMISEPSFLAEANSNQLGQPKFIELPTMPLQPTNEYQELVRTIRQAIDEESRGNIAKSLLYLLTRKHLSHKISQLREHYDNILVIFLFKACFYLDLQLQTNIDYSSLYELIKSVKSNLQGSPLTLQIEENLRNSLGNRYSDKLTKPSLSETIFAGAPSADHINIEKALLTRFKLWVEFFRKVRNTHKLVTQEERSREEVPLYPAHIK